MGNRLTPTLVTLLIAAVVTGVVITEKTSNQEVSDAAISIEAPPSIAPAPPEAVPTRKQESGPDARRSYEQLRLADPATGQIPMGIFEKEAEFAANLPRRDRTAYLEIDEIAAKTGEKVQGWQYRGPYNLGGRTRALAIDDSNPFNMVFLAGGISGGMWRSSNGGANWTLTTGSTQLHSVTCIAQDTRPGHENVWYYGTGESRGNSAGGGGAPFRGDGIFKSTDGGQSWSLLESTSTGEPHLFNVPWDYVHRLAVDASEPVHDEIYAAARGVINRSLDGGMTWNIALGDTLDDAKYTDVVIASDGVMYASLSSDGADAGIHRSTDGVSWTDITPPGLTEHQRIVLALAPSDETILYCLVARVHGTSDEGFYKYTYISGNGSGMGGQWEDRSATLGSVPGPWGPGSLQTYDSYCQTVAVSPNDPDLVFLGGIHLYRSYNGFADNSQSTWIGGWTYDGHHADQHWMMFRPGSTTIAYTGSDGGVHRTDDIHADTVTWASLNNGYSTSQFYTVAIADHVPESDIVIGGTQDNGSWWTDQVSGTADWLKQYGGDGSYCAVGDLESDPDRYYFSSQRGVIYYYGLDDFGNLEEWTRIDPDGGGDYLFINPFILDPNERSIMYVASSNGVWRNSDLTDMPMWESSPATRNWIHLTDWPVSSSITALAMTRAGSRTLYYGTSGGGLYRVTDAHTAPAGTMPEELHVGSVLPAGYVSNIVIDPTDDQHLLMCFSNYSLVSIWESTDGGDTWTDVEGNLGGEFGPSVRCVAVVPYAGHMFWFAGTSTGVYSAVDPVPGNVVWRQESVDLIGNVVVDMFAVRPAEGLVVAGTHGKGIYSVEIPAPTPAEETPTVRGRLAQNVPNPFNPVTNISFRLPVAGRATLDIYDVQGNHVRRLLDEEMGVDERSVSWNGTDGRGRTVSAGTYLYRIQSGDWAQQKKMTLAK